MEDDGAWAVVIADCKVVVAVRLPLCPGYLAGDQLNFQVGEQSGRAQPGTITVDTRFTL